jgi:hypothetical protein
MCRETLFRKLSKYQGENVLILSSPGFANVMGFRSELVQSLHLSKNTDDDSEYCVERVASDVTNECLSSKIKRNIYHINILATLLLCSCQRYHPNSTKNRW